MLTGRTTGTTNPCHAGEETLDFPENSQLEEGIGKTCPVQESKVSLMPKKFCVRSISRQDREYKKRSRGILRKRDSSEAVG